MTYRENGNLYILTQRQNGAVHQVSADGSIVSELFRPRPTTLRNLAGLAFHPDFDRPNSPGFGKLYTFQNVGKPADATGIPYIGESSFEFGDGLLAEWNATFDGQGNLTGVDDSTYREVFRVAQMSGNHATGHIGFNPYSQPNDEDYGLIYVLHGDSAVFELGGPVGDNGLGKLIRVDPLQDGANPYTIPSTNPFVGNATVLDEIYTLGHRNPHNLSFALDGQGNSHVLIAEIGEGKVEEVNMATPGGNFGWPYMEGVLNAKGTHDNSYVYPVA